MKIPETDIDIQELSSVPDLPGLPDAFKGRKADALRVPQNYAGLTDNYWVWRAIKARFGEVVNVPDGSDFHARAAVAGRVFVTGNPLDLEYFPKTHPVAPGRPRYRWFDDPADLHPLSGFPVQYGFLTEPKTVR